MTRQLLMTNNSTTYQQFNNTVVWVVLMMATELLINGVDGDQKITLLLLQIAPLRRNCLAIRKQDPRLV